jgi:hypothetical protein
VINAVAAASTMDRLFMEPPLVHTVDLSIH